MRKRQTSSEGEAMRVRHWHRRRGNNGEAVTDNEIANSLVIHERLIEIEDKNSLQKAAHPKINELANAAHRSRFHWTLVGTTGY